VGVVNHPGLGPWFGLGSGDLFISNNCNRNEDSFSRLGWSFGEGPGLNPLALFDQDNFRVLDYEVFKIVTE
jgi:hypothetical protein